MPVKITSLNCNGLRSANRKGLWDWVEKHSPDVLCFQEIRISEHQFKEAAAERDDYHCYYTPAERPGYAGTAILTKHEPTNVIRQFDWERSDSEGRFTLAEFGDVAVASVYVPSGSGLGEKQVQKELFMDRLYDQLLELRQKYERFVVCADWNTCHTEADLKNWKPNQKNSGFLPHEREWLTKLLKDGEFTDVFRTVEQPEHTYSWWSNRGNAYNNNVGWRLDYHLYSGNQPHEMLTTHIDRDAKLSDHAPVTHEYDWSLYEV